MGHAGTFTGCQPSADMSGNAGIVSGQLEAVCYARCLMKNSLADPVVTILRELRPVFSEFNCKMRGVDSREFRRWFKGETEPTGESAQKVAFSMWDDLDLKNNAWTRSSTGLPLLIGSSNSLTSETKERTQSRLRRLKCASRHWGRGSRRTSSWSHPIFSR